MVTEGKTTRIYMKEGVGAVNSSTLGMLALQIGGLVEDRDC